MCETKFRVWDKEAKQFKKWGSDPFLYLDMVDGTVYNLEANDYQDNFVPQQFIGLKDKNGAETYVGDVLKIKIGGDLQNGYYEVKNLWDLRIGMADKDSYMRISSDFEVIGNIFEDPELLADQKKTA